MSGRPIQCDRAEATAKAARHFWRKGYSKVSVASLVESTGLNRFGLYGEFGGKKGLFLKACECYSENARRSLLAPLAAAPDPEAALRRFFGGIIRPKSDPANPSGCLMANTLSDEGASDPEIQALLRQHFEAVEATFRKVLRRAAGKKARKAGIERGAALLLNTLLGLTYHARLGPEPKHLEAAAENAIHGALRAARGG